MKPTSTVAQQSDLANILPLGTHTELGRTVDARALHLALGSKQQFADWIKFRLQEIDATPGIEYVQYRVSEKTETGISNRTDFAITTDTAKEIAMLERNDQGKAIRRYFIDCERQLKANAPRPLTRADLARMVLEQESELEHARTLNASLEPKAEAFDEIISSTGLMSVAQAAKLLGIGEVRLFAILRARGVLMSREVSGEANHNVPYQRHLDAHQFEIKVRTTTLASGRQILTSTTYVTGSGLEYIRKLLKTAQPQLGLEVQS